MIAVISLPFQPPPHQQRPQQQNSQQQANQFREGKFIVHTPHYTANRGEGLWDVRNKKQDRFLMDCACGVMLGLGDEREQISFLRTNVRRTNVRPGAPPRLPTRSRRFAGAPARPAIEQMSYDKCHKTDVTNVIIEITLSGDVF
jgi:hypothetical protein